VGVDQQPDDLRQAGLGRAGLCVERQDGIGPDGPDCGGHPDDQEAKIGLAEVDVGAEQLDRAVAAGGGQGQVPRGAPKVDAGVFDNRPALASDLDGLAAGITEVEVTVGGAAAAIAVVAGANEDRRRAALEPRGGLECAQDAAHGPARWYLVAGVEVPVDQPVTKLGGPECIDLGAAADRDLGVKAAVGRPQQPGGLGEAQQRLDRSLVPVGIVDGLGIR